jgi:hypothetical protein
MKKNMNLLNAAKNADYIFISVMGPHAQESENDIFQRKAKDIDDAEESFWVSKINKKYIEECIQKLNGKNGYLILVEASNNGKSACDTTGSKHATHYSTDKTNWNKIDDRISPVTGSLGNGATAYYYDGIELYKDNGDQIDLDYYCEVGHESEAIRFRQGKSNVFAKKNVNKLKGGMSSASRRIVAILRLKYPYVVWVK